MKIILLFFFIAVYSINSYAQDDPKPSLPDFNDFVSKSGGIVKIEDFTTPRLILQLSYGDTRIRRVTYGSKSQVYYQVTSGDYTGSILAEDFSVLLDAFETLKTQSKEDLRPVSDILTKHYVDRNGFELGYIVEGKKLSWFVKQYKNCPRILYIKDPFSLEESLKQASIKLGELK